jgi:capsular polysaccharide biosynthesis protein
VLFRSPEFFIHPNSEDPKSGWQYVGYSKNYYKDLNKIFKSSHKEKSQFERLYLNRSNANFRKPSNLRLQNLMDELGYISTDFFGKKIKEQAEIINSANVIVAIHGAANSNFIFSKPDAQIVEIFSENYSPSNFEIITSDIGCNYRRVLCPASGCLDQPLKSDPHIDNNLIEFISIL